MWRFVWCDLCFNLFFFYDIENSCNIWFLVENSLNYLKFLLVNIWVLLDYVFDYLSNVRRCDEEYERKYFYKDFYIVEWIII